MDDITAVDPGHEAYSEEEGVGLESDRMKVLPRKHSMAGREKPYKCS